MIDSLIQSERLSTHVKAKGPILWSIPIPNCERDKGNSMEWHCNPVVFRFSGRNPTTSIKLSLCHIFIFNAGREDSRQQVAISDLINSDDGK